jgi:GT2 family glycosyltransferase
MSKAIIMLSWGQPVLTSRFMRCLENTTEDYHLYWIRNELSKDEHAFDSVVNNMPASCTYMVNIENKGFAGGVNQGVKEALKRDHEYIFLVNNDVLMGNGWADRMVNALKESSHSAIGPIVDKGGFQRMNLIERKYSNEIEPYRHRNIIEYDQQLARLMPPTPAVSSRNLAFFCTVFKREVWETTGFLDESLGVAYGEDNDYCHRMRQDGFTCGITPRVAVHHDTGASTTTRENKELRANAVQALKNKWGKLV